MGDATTVDADRGQAPHRGASLLAVAIGLAIALGATYLIAWAGDHGGNWWTLMGRLVAGLVRVAHGD